MATTYVVVDVQQASSSPVGSLQSPVLAGVATGDLILVAMCTWSVSANHYTPTDTASNTYVQIGTGRTAAAPGNPNQESLWACVGATGGSSFKVTSHLDGAYTTLIVWAIRPSTTIAYNADVASIQGSTTASNNDPTTSPAPPGADAFFLSVATTGGNNSLISGEGTGWNTTGVNGFTSTMKTNAKYGNQSATVALYTEYQVAATALKGEWIDANTGQQRGVIVASFGPAGGGAGTTTAQAYVWGPV